MKSFIFFSFLWLALGYVRPSSQTMIDYLPYNNTEPQSCPDKKLTCLQLNSKIIYQCPYGFYNYENSFCRLGKVFPGRMILDIPYNEAMQNTTSEIYEELYINFTDFFNKAFELDFRSINILTILNLSPRTSQRVNTLEEKNEATVTNKVKVTLITVFDEKSNMTNKQLQKTVNNSTDLIYLNVISFKGISGCDIVCDKKTTNCNDVEGRIPICECNQGLAKMNPEDNACRVCAQSCSAENNRFCLTEADHLPKCRCLPNFEQKGGECKACSIGFSGEDCQDSYMAIIIGISTVCGVLLVALIGVTICLVRKREPKMEHRQLVSDEYASLDNLSGIPPATSVAESGRIFPRIRATNGAPSSKATAENPTNFYEGGATNRGYFPEQDYRNDNWLEMPSKY